MKIGLKGITKIETITQTKMLDLTSYSFDLRPKSFNFTPKGNIQKILESLNSNLEISLMFENEKDYIVTEIYQEVESYLFDEANCLLEFAGSTPLIELEKFEIPYIWHYHDKEKLRNIENTHFLKRIVLHHEDLEYLNSKGELFGYLQLLSDSSKNVKFELQLDWNISLIESMFSYFDFAMLSFEITNIVELSYQQPDHLAIQSEINYYKKLIS
jgi:hypothetical protein